MLILASTSPYRRRLLERVGIEAKAVAPTYEEVDMPHLSAEETVRLRALEKARSVATAHEDAWIIGSDQGLISEGALLGKGRTAQGAVDQLMRLSGRSATLYTAMTLIAPHNRVEETLVDEHILQFRRFDRAFAQNYVAFDNPVDCAGSFMIESAGPVLFERVSGHDPTAIEGLPIMLLVQWFERHGLSFFTFT